MLNKKILIPLVLISTAIFAIGYGVIYKYEPLSVFFNTTMLPDSGDNPPESSQLSDVSQMFNERGFYKSNGFTADESELINNFNGNLIYQIPLYNILGQSGIACDVKLTYNGSVGHQVILSTLSQYQGTGYTVDKYNISSPEWVLSVNGIGVQTFNFEDNLLTQPSGTNGSTVSGLNVKKLIPGYHFDDRMGTAGISNRDRISILMGDGSLLTLYNFEPGHNYTGLYKSDNQGSHIIADVYFDPLDQSSNEFYRNRYVELMMGDGLVYVFREYKRNYRDVTTTTGVVNDDKKPQVLLLERIRNQHGTSIILTYNLSHNWKGRPLLTNIGVYNQVIDIDYNQIGFGGSSINAVRMSNLFGGSFAFLFDDVVDYNVEGGNKIGVVKEIRNPLGQKTIITNEAYTRTLQNVRYKTSGNRNINSNDLSRIITYTNFLGGKREYEYYGQNQMAIQTILGVFRSDNYFKGNGRDAFYTNMVSNKSDFFNSTTSKSTTTFTYSFTDPSGNFSDHNNDPEDDYSTLISIVSDNSNTVNESKNLSSLYKYKVYPVKNYGFTNQEATDVQGTTKLISEEVLNTNGTTYSTTSYEYDSAPFSNSVYNGSFLITKKTNAIGVAERVWDFLYKFLNDDKQNVLTEKVEVDPNDYKTQIFYYSWNRPVNFWNNYYGPSGPNDTINLEGAKTFYKIEIDTLVKRLDNNRPRSEYPGTLDVLLSSASKVFALDTNRADSYIGQLIAERQYRNGTNDYPIVTSYEYYKTDSLGKHLYNPARVPYIEGNIKRIIKPDNQEERYFYFPFNRGQNQLYVETDDIPGALPLPQISFKIKFNDGAEDLNKSEFIDTRLPTRIDKYRRINSTSVDSISKVYMDYNSFGKPSRIIDQNGYVSQVDYDFTYNRVLGITLPGDFSRELSRDTMFFVDKTIDTSVTIHSNGWGSLYSNTGIPQEFRYTTLNGFQPIYQMHLDNERPDLLQPFIKFEYNNLSGFNSITSASLRVAPLNYTLMTGTILNFTIYQTDYSARVMPAFGYGTRLLEGPLTRELNPQYYNVYSNASIGPYPLNSWNGQTTTCNFNEHINNVDVKSILEHLRTNNKNLHGFIITPLNSMNPPPEGIHLRYIMNMAYAPSCFDFEDWKSNYKPVLQIEGNYTRRDTIRQRIIGGGTIIYEYDDVNNSVKIKSRLNNNPGLFKTIRNHYDGFGNLKQKDVFTSSTVFNSYQYKYNFSNKLAEEIDALNHSTKFSYDIADRNFVTKFADDSTTNNDFGYTNSLGGYFGSSYNKFVEIREFKDETKRSFYKYFDAVGNLLREVKYVSNNYTPDNPFDPDTTGNETDDPGDIPLIADYKYDDLYRLVEVKTPGNKTISYSYDSYGRQYSRSTPDAGLTKYLYDQNSNLKYSQDAAQQTRGNNIFTFRNYDALNRILSIGETQIGNSYPDFDNIDPENPPELDSPFGTDMFVINIYDTILNPSFSNFSSNKPSDFNTVTNYTKGKLVATAYRTRLTDNWNYKYYRYDARGNAMKMWSYVDGLGWKSIIYQYNSQNQNTYFDYQPNQTDGKQFKFGYDEAGRLIESAFYTGSWTPTPEEDDGPNSFYNLNRYTYNANSQIATHGHNGNASMITFTYTNRNWVNWTSHSPGQIFRYVLFYNPNGNIRYQDLQGSYSGNFAVTGNRKSVFIYDKSNRLLKANMINTADSNSFDVINSYDNDGNLLSMKRYGSNNNVVDNFNYNYYSATNRLQKVNGTKNQYTYDNNGNLTSDELNKNLDITYDYRNLMLENTNKLSQFTFKTKYWYDEAGNRIRKQVMRYDPEGGIEEGDGSGGWVLDRDEFYVRDMSGREVAIYYGSTLQQWNLFGLDQIGHMKADLSKFFYLKDHLGSTRVVIDTLNQIVSAQDYDPWGYLMENRTYETGISKYKFTGKERDRDIESNYDYFGARYYDPRIANWTSIDPLFQKHFDFSPYNYVLRSPNVYVDPNGMQKYQPGYLPHNEPVGGVSDIVALGTITAIGATQSIWNELEPDELFDLFKAATVIEVTALFNPIQWIINNVLTVENTGENGETQKSEKEDAKPKFPVPEIDWEKGEPIDKKFKPPPPGSKENWRTKKPDPKESLRDHTKSKDHEPHWDWKDEEGENWRIYPNRIEHK